MCLGDGEVLTIHELLLLHRQRETRAVPLEVHCEDVKTRTTVVTLNREGSSLMLNREIIANGTRAVADEVVSLREASTFDEIVEKIVQRFLDELSTLRSPFKAGW